MMYSKSPLPGSFLTDPVLQCEFKRYMDEYLAKYCTVPGIRTLGDIIRWNNAHRPDAVPYGQDILEACEYHTDSSLTSPDYLVAKYKAVTEAAAGIDNLLAEKQLDVLVTAAASRIPPMCGYPILSVPAGNGSDGCPVGMSFIAGAFSEPKLLAYGYAFEQASHLRVVPQCAKEYKIKAAEQICRLFYCD